MRVQASRPGVVPNGDVVIQVHGTTVDFTVRVPVDAFMRIQELIRDGGFTGSVEQFVEATVMNFAGLATVDDRILMFHRFGFPDTVIARETGMTNRYIGKFRRDRGLKPNKLKPARKDSTT